MNDVHGEPLTSVQSSMNYILKTDERPAYYLYTPEDGRPAPPATDKQQISFFDIRPMMNSVTLDANGFSFVSQALPTIDYLDAEAVVATYYPACVDLVRLATGATRVHAFDHNVRDRSESEQPGVDEPVRFAHNDYTEKSSPQRVRDLMGDEAETLLGKRYQFINVWRPLRGPVVDFPLAVCDAQSLDTDDFVATDLRYRDRTGEIYSVRFNADHRWIYLSEMQPDEVLLLKCFDSKAGSHARYTAHASFRHPDADDGVLTRRSIEVRTIAFFDE